MNQKIIGFPLPKYPERKNTFIAEVKDKPLILNYFFREIALFDTTLSSGENMEKL